MSWYMYYAFKDVVPKREMALVTRKENLFFFI